MENALVIVESPAKARTIEKYLGAGYRVTASTGHLRDLPKSTIGVDIAKMTGDGAMADHRSSRFSHVLTRAIGTSETVSPESLHVAVEKGDVFLVCTDGVSTMLDDERLREILVSSDSPETIIERMSNAVCEAGAVDNYSMSVCVISGALPSSEIHTEDEMQESAYLEERCKG